MLRRILNLFRQRPRREVRYVPSIPDLPSLWHGGSLEKREPNLAALDGATTDQLTRLCDDYWDSFLLDDDLEQQIIRDGCVHRRAMELLAARGSESLSWARARLAHRGYDAREDAASLIMQLAQSKQLGQHAEAIGDELVVLALRAPEEDTKEAQAASAALMALSVIGGAPCMKAVRGVLTSSEWDEDDNQWQAAEILAEMTGEPLMEADDPVVAAKAWLDRNPGTQA
jgi:hypothetical protein